MTLSGEKPGTWGGVSTPTPAALAENELHIWRVHLCARQPQVEAMQRLLSPDELERAERFVQGRDRYRFVMVHGAVRRILSRYVPVHPHCHVFHKGRWGKPYVHSSSQSTPSFNLSHSGDMAVVAIASGCDVGVDIEQIRTIAEEASIVDRVFSEPDRSLYHATPISARSALFFRLWTRHEAQLKATGHGLASGAPNLPGYQDEASGWTIEYFAPAAGYAASVAATGSIGRVIYLDFTRNDDVTAWGQST
jgi:4'-phosphopantetheinyl transferase